MEHGVDALGGADEADADHNLEEPAEGVSTESVHGDALLSGVPSARGVRVSRTPIGAQGFRSGGGGRA